MVKDIKHGGYYRADKLIKENIDIRLKKKNI